MAKNKVHVEFTTRKNKSVMRASFGPVTFVQAWDESTTAGWSIGRVHPTFEEQVAERADQLTDLGIPTSRVLGILKSASDAAITAFLITNAQDAIPEKKD